MLLNDAHSQRKRKFSSIQQQQQKKNAPITNPITIVHHTHIFASHNSKQPKRLIFSIEDAIPVDDDECALGHVTSSNNNYLTDLYD